MLGENFITDQYPAILGNLMDNEYLTQKEVDILKRDSPNLEAVGDEKEEIGRKESLNKSLIPN